MSQAPATAFPTVGETPDSQRMLTQLRELVRSFASGVFLLRPQLETIRVVRDGDIPSLRWGSLERLLLMTDRPIQLPRIEARFVGLPLEFILLDTGNVATLTPVGFGLSRKDRPLINGAATLAKNATGLYTLKTDGQNWFTAP